MESERKQREFQRKSEDLQADVEYRRQEVLQRVSQRMRDIVQKLAASKNIDVIIDADSTLYFKPALDLTKEATAEYDKLYPVK